MEHVGAIAEKLHRKLRYDPKSGQFHWRKRGRGVPDISREAGRVNGNGYREICIEGRLYPAHRLAWLYMTCEWPANEIDHRDTDRANNRWANLRIATKAQNQANTGPKKCSKSGVKGVFQSPRKAGRWCAQIRRSGGTRHIGTFSTLEEASAAYEAELKKLHGEYARIR